MVLTREQVSSALRKAADRVDAGEVENVLLAIVGKDGGEGLHGSGEATDALTLLGMVRVLEWDLGVAVNRTLLARPDPRQVVLPGVQ